MTATRSPPRSPHVAVTGRSSGPTTRVVTVRPPLAPTSARTVPSPPSATGTRSRSAPGNTRRTPRAMARATSVASRLPLNDWGATTIRRLMPAPPDRASAPLSTRYRTLSPDHLGQELTERGTQLRISQGHVDRGAKKVELVAGIVAPARELIRVDRAALHQRDERIRQVDLAARTHRGLSENVEHVRRQHEPADLSQIRGRVVAPWFLDHRHGSAHPPVAVFDFHHAVLLEVVRRYTPNPDDGRCVPFGHLDELCATGGR